MTQGALWGGRFRESLDKKVLQYSESLSFDRRLAAFDILGSRAHARMLGKCGILTSVEVSEVERALEQISGEIESGTFPFRPELEDIHMNIEARLTEIAGDLGKKIHTGRSRNDQVALDMKLYCRETAVQWTKLLALVVQTLHNRARDTREMILPACTHLQAAQPISWAQYFLAFAAMYQRDLVRLDSYRMLHDVSPLGAGALAGSSLPLDPGMVATELGFSRAFSNSYDVVGDRDFICDLLHIASMVMLHTSRFAEDCVIFSSSFIKFIELPDSLCTGSSMMPQKKNPDVMELARGKTASVLGHFSALMTLLKGLPSSYNRDLQQDKEHLFAVVDIVTQTLGLLPVVFSELTILEENCRAAAEQHAMMATDLAEALVKVGVPFRSSHEIVGRVVRELQDRGRPLHSLTLEELRQHAPAATSQTIEALRVDGALTVRTIPGSTGAQSILSQLTTLESWLSEREQMNGGRS